MKTRLKILTLTAQALMELNEDPLNGDDVEDIVKEFKDLLNELNGETPIKEGGL